MGIRQPATTIEGFQYKSHPPGLASATRSRRRSTTCTNPGSFAAYPAIDFLRSVEPELRNADVLEFGCGQSTKWLAPQVRSLLGVERFDDFRRVLEREFADDSRIRFVSSKMPFDVEGPFDIVILDGSPRIKSAHFAPSVLKEDGIIIYDNSDVQSLAEIPEYLHGRVDFFVIRRRASASREPRSSSNR
jgi:predicted O-methyltransferase YrrM